MVIAIAAADFVTGYELTLSVLYFIPLFLTTWHCGAVNGFVLALFAVAAALVSDVLTGHGYSHPFYRWWDGLIKLTTWTIFVLLLARLKAALDRSDERFVTVLEGLDAIVHVADLDEGTLLYANPSYRALIGDEERVDHLDARWAPSPSSVFARAQLLDSQGVPNDGVTAELHDVPSERAYMVHARAIRWVNGRLVRLLIATDITVRRQAELSARLRQGQIENQTRLVMIGEMASTLAHELNQPLAAIANYNRGVLRHLKAGRCDVGDLIEALEKSASQAERAGRIIHRVRDLVRKRGPERTACSVPELVERVASTLEPDIARSRVRLNVCVASDLPPVHADGVLIEQALLNLCRNAIESMRDAGAAQRELRISAEARSDLHIELAVADTGPGVPREIAENRQELFFTTRGQGTGIGLHVCRSVMEAHDTRMVVKERPGGGSIFSFALPKCQT
jgi:hypothetical protein